MTTVRVSRGYSKATGRGRSLGRCKIQIIGGAIWRPCKGGHLWQTHTHGDIGTGTENRVLLNASTARAVPKTVSTQTKMAIVTTPLQNTGENAPRNKQVCSGGVEGHALTRSWLRWSRRN